MLRCSRVQVNAEVLEGSSMIPRCCPGFSGQSVCVLGLYQCLNTCNTHLLLYSQKHAATSTRAALEFALSCKQGVGTSAGAVRSLAVPVTDAAEPSASISRIEETPVFQDPAYATVAEPSTAEASTAEASTAEASMPEASTAEAFAAEASTAEASTAEETVQQLTANAATTADMANLSTAGTHEPFPNQGLQQGSQQAGQQPVQEGQQAAPEGQQALQGDQQPLQEVQQLMQKGQQAVHDGLQPMAENEQALGEQTEALLPDSADTDSSLEDIIGKVVAEPSIPEYPASPQLSTSTPAVSDWPRPGQVTDAATHGTGSGGPGDDLANVGSAGASLDSVPAASTSTSANTVQAEQETPAAAADFLQQRWADKTTAAPAAFDDAALQYQPWPDDGASDPPVSSTAQQADTAAEVAEPQTEQQPDTASSDADVGTTAHQTTSFAQDTETSEQQWPDGGSCQADVGSGAHQAESPAVPVWLQVQRWPHGGSLEVDVGSSSTHQAQSPAEPLELQLQRWQDGGSLEVNLGSGPHRVSSVAEATLQPEQWLDGSAALPSTSKPASASGHSQTSHTGRWRDVNSTVAGSVRSTESSRQGLDSDDFSDPIKSRSNSIDSSWSSSSSVSGDSVVHLMVPALEGQGSAQSDILILDHAEQLSPSSPLIVPGDPAEAEMSMIPGVQPVSVAAPEVRGLVYIACHEILESRQEGTDTRHLTSCCLRWQPDGGPYYPSYPITQLHAQCYAASTCELCEVH